MGFSSISPISLLIIFLIIVLLFGTKKLRNIGEDLGHAFKSFKKGIHDNEENKKKIESKKTKND